MRSIQQSCSSVLVFVEFNVSLQLNFNQSHYFSCGEWLSISMLV